MTSLLILYPDIPRASIGYVPTNEQDFHPSVNTTRGERWQEWWSSANLDTHDLKYDCGTGVTKSANFLVVTRLDRLKSVSPGANTSFVLAGSADDISYNTVYSVGNLGTYDLTTLYGPNTNDYITVSTNSTAYRYWRIRIKDTTPTSFALKIGKIYFGSYFDMGREPNDYKLTEIKPDSTFRTSSGMVANLTTALPKKRFECEWVKLTTDKIDSFYSTLFKYKDTTPIFLYTTVNHRVLDNLRLLHCRIVSAETQPLFNNYYKLKVVFEQNLG